MMIKIQIKTVIVLLATALLFTPAKAGWKADSGEVFASENQGLILQIDSRVRRMSPSQAVQAARRRAPRSRVLGVKYLKRRNGYSVRVRSNSRVRRVFIDARKRRR